MSGSGGDDVRVSISADSSGFEGPVNKSYDAAKQFAEALRAVGNDLRKVTPEMLGITSASDGLANAISKATAAARDAAVTFASFSTAGLGVDTAFKSAAESAEVFTTALNPTPLRLLRGLMGEEIPAAFRLTQTATAAVIESQIGLNAGFKSAEDSARVFTAALNPAPLRALRDAMSATATGSKVIVSSLADAIGVGTGLGRSFLSAADSAQAFLATLQPTPLSAFRSAMVELDSVGSLTTRTLAQNIEAANGLGSGFKSAAQSAQVFTAALDPSPLTTLRTLMAGDIPEAAAVTTNSFKAIIEAAVGVGRAFKSAEDSAAVFSKALDPTPLQQMRSLMAEGLPQAAAQTTVNFKAAIEATTGVDREFKSAAASAAVFTREIARIPLAQLRTSLSAVASAGAATFSSLQQNIDVANRIGPEFKSAADSASVFSDALNGTVTPLQKTRALMADDEPQRKHAHGSSMMTMELIRLGHEGMVGNWTRIPGTLIVLAEYSDTVRNALTNMISSFGGMQLAGVGAVLAVAAAFVELVLQAHAATIAVNEATNAATMQGRSPTQARAEMKAYGETMRSVGVMGQTALAQVSSAISQLAELSDAQKQKLADVGTQLFLNWNSDAKKTGEEISHIFASTSSLETYLQQQHLLSGEQQRAWASATTAAQKYDIGLAAIGARLGPIGAQIKQQAEDARLNLANQVAAAGLGISPAPMAGRGDVFAPKHLGDFEPGTQQQSPASAEDNAAVIELNKHTQELVKLKADLQHAQNALDADTKAGDTAAIAADQTAIRTAQDLIQMWKAQGDASWAQKQSAALDAILQKVAQSATSSKTIALDENQARIKFWDEQAAQAGLTEGQITVAQNNASRARRALAAEELRIKATGESSWMASQQARLSEILVNVAANAKTSKSLAEDENRTRIKFWAEVAQQADLSEKQITEARAQGNRARLALAGEELRGGEQAARQALSDRLAALSEQQAANHDDYAKVMQIEQQKLALLASAGKDGTRQYEQELIKRDELARQHATQQAEIARNAIAKERASDAAELAQAKALMDVEVSAERMTKAEEERALQAYAKAQQAIEIDAQQAYIDLVRNQPKEYQAALDQMSTMKAQFAARDAQFNARMAADQKATWDRMTAPIDNAISGQVSGVLRGTQTIGMAVNKMAGDVVISYAQMAAKAGLHWIGLQLMQILWTGTTEATKTALTQGGAAARIAINNAETASGNSGLLIRVARWIAAELGLTAATTAQAGARTTVQAAADAEAMTQTSLANVAEAESYAAVGAAAAGQSVAAIPVTGWAMAPGVAAATYGELSAYGALASFAVGAWNLPQDMPANLHAGEMVIPANFADGLRGAMSGGGGGGGTTLNYAPNIRGGGADMARAMSSQAAAFKSYLWHATRNGALALPNGR